METNMTHIPPDMSPAVSEMERITIQLAASQLGAFFPLLQQGVTLPVTVGCSLRSLLCDQLGIPGEYVTGRITTLFIDNSPVDDLERTIVHDGSRVTLSAAMPGLVGATMRRGGFYAALRRGISHVAEEATQTNSGGTVRLKLFNLLLAELGPLILARGIILDRTALIDLLKHLPDQPGQPPPTAARVVVTALFRE